MATRPLDPERAQAISAAKIAARLDVACGGIDLDATLEALRARVLDARASEDASEGALADRIERALAEAGWKSRADGDAIGLRTRLSVRCVFPLRDAVHPLIRTCGGCAPTPRPRTLVGARLPL